MLETLVTLGWARITGEYPESWLAYSKDGYWAMGGWRSGDLFCVHLTKAKSRSGLPLRSEIAPTSGVDEAVRNMLAYIHAHPTTCDSGPNPGQTWRRFTGHEFKIEAIVEEETRGKALVVLKDRYGIYRVCDWSEFEAFVSEGSYRGPRYWKIADRE